MISCAVGGRTKSFSMGHRAWSMGHGEKISNFGFGIGVGGRTKVS